VKIQYFEVEIFYIGIFIQIQFEVFEAFATFAHLQVLFDFRFNGVISFEKGKMKYG